MNMSTPVYTAITLTKLSTKVATKAITSNSSAMHLLQTTAAALISSTRGGSWRLPVVCVIILALSSVGVSAPVRRNSDPRAAQESQCQGGACSDDDLMKIYRKESPFFKDATLELMELEISVLGHPANVTVGIPRQRNTIDFSGINVFKPGFQKECGWTRELRYIGSSYFPSWILEVKCSPSSDTYAIEPEINTGNGRVVTVLKKVCTNDNTVWERTDFPDNNQNSIVVGCICKPS